MKKRMGTALLALIWLFGVTAPIESGSSDKPYIMGCLVWSSNTPRGMETALDVRVADPNGSISSVSMTAPDGVHGYGFDLQADHMGSGEYFKNLTGAPNDGQYTFTVTDNNGNTATSYFTLAAGAETIPLPNTTSFRASGDPLAPTLSWSTIPGYSGNLYYRVRVQDTANNATVYTSSRAFIGTSMTVPDDVLVSEHSYRWWVEAFDSGSGETCNKRAQSQSILLAIDNTRPYFSRAAAFKWHNQDGSFSTGLWAVGGKPSGQPLSLTVSGPNGFNYTTPVDSCFTNQCVLNVPGAPEDGLYTLQVEAGSGSGNTAVSTFRLKSYDVPPVDSTTMRASGDPLAPVLSWGAPVDVDRPLYYQVHIFTNQSVPVLVSSWVTNTSLSVQQGVLQPGVSYEWHVVAYDDPSMGSANRSISTRIPLTLDNASPYFTYATVNDRHDFDGQFIGINVQLVDPDGTLPGSLPSLTVTSPGGFSHAFQANDYTRDINEYFRRISGTPQEGLYTFTAVDVNGNSAVTRHYHKPARGSIPLLDEGSFQVSGNPLAPTISWSAINGYPSHLYYRVRINDRQGNMVYHTPQPYPPDSYQVIPSGKLVAGAVYRYRVEAYDSPYFQTYDNRSNSSFRSLMVDMDDDGMDDGWEIYYFGSLVRTGSDDLDGDGLTDLQEFQRSTSPILIDSDGDGYSDGREVSQGTDPLNNNSKPGVPGGPFFAYCNVMATNNTGGGGTALIAQVFDPGGTVPGSIDSVTITEPGGAVTHDLNDQNFLGNNTYLLWVAGSILPEGEYTFRVTDKDLNTATSTYYHHAGPVIPLADPLSFMATGNSLTPTLSWSAIPGYEGNLFYRAQILRGNTTVWTSGFTTNTFVNVPASANLQAGESYQWQVQAFDNYRFEVSDHCSTSASVPLSVGSDTRPYFRSATIFNRHRTDGFFAMVSVVLTDPNGTLPGSIKSITVDRLDTQGQPLEPAIYQYVVRSIAEGGDYDPMWGSFDHLIPGRPVDGIYRFTAVDAEDKQAVTYDYVKSYDVPLVDSATMRASGDPYASVGPTLTFSWGAPADMDRPLYYHAMISEFDGAGNEVREVWRSSYSPETSATVPAQNLPLAPLQSPSSYRWKVRAYDGNYYIHNNRSDSERIELTIDNSRPYIRTAGIYHSRYNDGYYTAMDSYVLDPEGDSRDTTEWVRVTGPNSYLHQYQQEDLIWGGMAAYPNEWWTLAPPTLERGVYTVTAKKKGQAETVVTHEFLDTARDIPLPDENSFKVVLSGDPAVSWSAIVSWAATPGFQDHLFYRVRVKDSAGNILYNPSREPLTAASIPSTIFPVQPSCEAAPRKSYFLRMETYDKREFPIFDNRSVSRYLPLHPQLDLASIGATRGSDIMVPITLKNAPGLKVSSTSNTIVFDSSLLDFQGVAPGQPESVAGKVVSSTVVDVGRIRVDISGNNNPMGNGVVAYLLFHVREGTGFLGDIPVKSCPSAITTQGDSVYTGGTWGGVSVMSPRGSCASGGGGTSIAFPGPSYPTLQDALDAAQEGDTVLVSPGIYRVDRLNFNGKGIHLNCDGASGSCILDGSSKNQIFKLTSGEGNDSVICGFTIQNGFADYGGAIFLAGASPTFQNCTITGNTASTGGGAIHCKNSSPTFSACTISANGAMNGGAIFLDSSSPTFDRCWISKNSATDGTGHGGGVYAVGSGTPVFMNCLLNENHAGVTTGAGGTGGAIHAESGGVTVTNCTLEGNQALGASARGGAVSFGTGSFSIANSILWGNLAAGVANQVYGTANITYSDVQGGYPGSGNIASDPLFVDRAMGQYQLQPGSPAIDQGNRNAAGGGVGASDILGNVRISGAEVDMGAFESMGNCYADSDGDGYGAGNVASTNWTCPSGQVPNNLDCDDGNAGIHPGAVEICDGVDNNCNGTVDEGCPPADSDGDGITDSWELANFGSLSRDGTGDADGDGLSDLLEFQGGTNPNNADSDGDGYSDAREIAQGTNPLDPASHLGVPDTERAALIALYNSTNGAVWTNRTNWLDTNVSECTWNGVTCDGNGHVSLLNLSENNLTGTVPPELANLSHLGNLYLYKNGLSGPIPASLGNLANLQYLLLQGNQLSGNIPTELGNLTNLLHLSFENNQLSGAIPAELGSLTHLQSLNLAGNSLSGPIPSTLGSLANLTHLWLWHNQLTGPIPATLGNLTNLQLLWLSTNQLSGSIPAELAGLANLRSLYLAFNLLSGPIPPQLGGLSNLQAIEFQGNLLTGSIPVELGNLTNLTELDLGGNQLTGSIPSALGALPNLQSLSLYANRLSGPIPAEIGNLTTLQGLYLNGNQLGGAVPAELKNLTALSTDTLDLRWNALQVDTSTPEGAALRDFLNSKQRTNDWESTQTVAPTNVAIGAATGDSVTLSWTQILYTGDSGGYEVWSGGTLLGTTADKFATGFTAAGLTSENSYTFTVRSVTNPHLNNQNTVLSGFTPSVGVSRYYLDADADGYGDPAHSTLASFLPNGHATNNADCDDTDSSVHPGAPVVCDGRDHACTGQICHTITASAGANGTIDPLGAVTVGQGGSLTFSITPDPGYRVVSVLVDGVSVGAVASYPFTNVTDNHTIAATFAPVVPVFAISASAGPNGSISPSGSVMVTQGADQSFTIIPDGGYGVADVLVDGVPMGPRTSYTFPNVQADHSISASFSLMDTWYRDADGDGFGDPNNSMQSAVRPPGYVSDNSDCDDTDPRINPATVWVNDYDGDGYSSWSGTILSCTRPVGFVLPDELIAQTVDCNDFDATVHPGAAKVCGRNLDCGGQYDGPECRIVSNTIVTPTDPNTQAPIPVRAGEPLWVTATFQNNSIQGIETIRPDCFNTTFTVQDGSGNILPPLDRMRVAYGIPDDVITIGAGEVFSVTCNMAEMVRPEVLEPGNYKVEATYSNAIKDPDLHLLPENSCPSPPCYECTNPPCVDLWTGAVSSPAAPVVINSEPPAFTGAAQVAFSPPDWNVRWGVLPGMTVGVTLTEIAGHGVGELDLNTLQLNGIGATSYSVGTDSVTAFFNGYLVARSLGTVVSGSVVYPTVECRLSSDDNVRSSAMVVMNDQPPATFYEDWDRDGFGDPASSVLAWTAPPGYADNSLDPDDHNSAATPSTFWYKDSDGDGYSDGTTRVQGDRPQGFRPASELLATGGDCNDSDALVHPGGVEVCDGKDNNCNGLTDDSLGDLCSNFRETVSVPETSVRPGEPLWVTATFTNNSGGPIQTIRPDCFNTTFTVQDESGNILPPLDRMRVAYGIPDDVVTIPPGSFSVTCNLAEMFRPEVLASGEAGERVIYKVQATYSNVIQDPDIDAAGRCTHPNGICYPMWTGAVASTSTSSVVLEGMPVERLAADITFDPAFWYADWASATGRRVKATITIRNVDPASIDPAKVRLNGKVPIVSGSATVSGGALTVQFDAAAAVKSFGAAVPGMFYPTVEGRYFTSTALFSGSKAVRLTVVGDYDGDGDIDSVDVNFVLKYRNKPATVCPDCDLDGDKTITVLDARKLVLRCTRPGCATR